MKIHVAIVSEQVLPTIIPALMDRPDKVYLACSKDMAELGVGDRLSRALLREDIGSEILLDVPDAGLAAIRRYADVLADSIRELHPEAKVVLNATGGTKPMSFGFIEAFRAISASAIYTDTRHRCIEHLFDENGGTSDPIPMMDVLDVPAYLEAQGFRLKSIRSDNPFWRQQASERNLLCSYLAKNAAVIQGLIGELNYLADRALDGQNSLIQPVQSFASVPRGNKAEALGKIAAANLLRWQDGSQEIEFVDLESLRFLHGGWLEEYVWRTLRDAGSYDCRMGVDVKWEDGEKNPNEFDVIAAHCNQLLFVECKTVTHREEKDTNTAYKVESLGKKARGVFGESWVVCARTPTVVMRDRAEQANIRIFGPEDLLDLGSLATKWMEGKP